MACYAVKRAVVQQKPSFLVSLVTSQARTTAEIGTQEGND